MTKSLRQEKKLNILRTKKAWDQIKSIYHLSFLLKIFGRWETDFKLTYYLKKVSINSLHKETAFEVFCFFN